MAPLHKELQAQMWLGQKNGSKPFFWQNPEAPVVALILDQEALRRQREPQLQPEGGL
jgi:hypothetical protein